MPFLYSIKLFFLSPITYFLFSWFICSLNFLAIFSISTKNFISISLFPINTMSSAYANIFDCYLPIFISLGTNATLCITFCTAKLNNIGDKGSPFFRPILFSKKYYNVSSILTALLVFSTHVLHKFVNLVEILNYFIHSHSVSLCIESYTF